MSGVPACLEHAPFHLSKILNMKPRLSATLLSALLAAAPAVHAAVTGITPAVKPTEIAQLSSKQPKGTTTATNQYYVLTQDVTIKTSATNDEDKKPTTSFISSSTKPTYIFTSKTPDNPATSGIDERYSLTFSGIDGSTGTPDTHRVFRDISLHIEDLESLVLDGDTATNTTGVTSAPGAFLFASNVSNSVIKNVGKVLFADTRSQTWSISNRGGVLSIINSNNTFSFEDCGSVTFRNTSAAQVHESKVADTIQVAGGAIYAGVAANGLNFKNNGAVLFDSSSVSAVEEDTTTYGGAICIYSGDVNFTGNDSVTFTGCSARHDSRSSYGGAISLHNGIDTNRWRNVLSLIDNKDVTFSNNSVTGMGVGSSPHTSGGAIAAWHDDRIIIKNNTGAVTFSGNYAYNEGGAIFAKAAEKADGKMHGPEITISGNNSVKFTGNYVGREENGKTNVYGGAVYAASGLTLANNGTVEFSGNYLTSYQTHTGYGAAIYIGHELSSASLVIAGNESVVFENNYVKSYTNSTSGNCRMGSIYGENEAAQNAFSTSSSSTSSIEFRDAVYLMGDLDINSSYLDIDNVKQDATGNVVFTGQYVQGYLQNQKSFDSSYAGKVDISRTSTLGGDVTVHGGSLQIVEHAIVNIGGMLDIGGKLSVDGQQVNTARVDVASGKLNVGATKDASGTGLIQLEKNGSLNLTGDAVVTAGQVTLDGATLDMSDTAKITATGGDLTASNAAGITMTGGTLAIGSKKLTLDTGAEMNLSGSAAVTAGQVTLTDAALNLAGGTLTATAGDLVVTKSGSTEVMPADEGAAEKTYDISVTGGKLDIGARTLDLGAGTSMELSGGQVIAGQVELKNAALDMAGNAVLTASGQVELAGSTLTMEGGTLNASAQGLAVQAADIKMTGGTLNNGEHALALGSGTSMELSGNAAVTAGQVTLTDATLKMQGGTLTATGGDLVVTKSDSPEVALADEGAAEKTYDVAISGGTLDLGTKTLALGTGTSMEMTGGQVNAGQVELEGAKLTMEGGTLAIGSNKLALGSGAEMDMSGGLVTAGQVALEGAKLTIAGEAQVDAQGGVTVQRTEDRQAELVMKGGTLNAGTLKLQDATLQMEGGVVDASGGVTLYDAASLVMKGGELKAGESDITLGAGMQLSLSESAVVSAGRITLGASATLAINASSAGAEDIPAVQTLSVVDNMDPTVQGAMASATLSGDLVLMGGSTFDATGGFISLDGHALTLSTSDESKINLVLTLDQLADPDTKVIIFSDVTVVNFLFNLEGEAALASADDIVSVSASDYFNSGWTEEYYINFDKSAGLVYLSSGLPTGPSDPVTPPDTPPVPEPTTSTLSLVALAGLALRRRRRH